MSSRPEPVCRDEAASAAGIGRPLAAYHLDKLVESGLLTVTYRRQAGRSGPGAGRPAKLYAISDREFAARTLVQALAGDRSGTSRAALHNAAYRLGTELTRSEQARLDRVLSAHGYDPVLRRADVDTVIRLRNCPFHHLAQRHRDLVCDMNLSLIGGMVAGLRLPDWQPGLDPRPGHCCVAIEPPEGKSDNDSE